MSLSRAGATALTGTLVFAAAFGAGRLLTRIEDTVPAPDSAGPPPGALSGRVVRWPSDERLPAAERPDEGALVAVIRAEDVRTCEDLGRQLREAGRSEGAPIRLVVTDTASREAVRAFLRRERIPASLHLLPGGHAGRTPSPAVLRVRGDSLIGVAFPARVAGVRPWSFAGALRRLDGETAAPAGAADGSILHPGGLR